MFERITVEAERKHTVEYAFKFGFLAEAMLFYGRVRIVTDHISLPCLIHEFEPHILEEYLSRGYLTIEYENNATGTFWPDSRRREIVHPRIVPIPDGGLMECLDQTLKPILTRTGKTRRMALRLKRFIHDHPIDEKLVIRFLEGLNQEYARKGARVALTTIFPEETLPERMRFDIELLANGLVRVETDINFAALNTKYHRDTTYPPYPFSRSLLNPEISTAYLIGRLLRAHKLAEDAATAGSEMALEPLYSNLIALRTGNILRPRVSHEPLIRTFQDLLFDDANALSEVIDSGERTFGDFLPVLEKAGKFRTWLQANPPSSDLLKEYMRAVCESTWLERLPARSLRWAIFAGAGVLLDLAGAGGMGTAGGLALGAADTFLLDKLIKGWKPHHFVNTEVRRFLGRKAN